MAFSPAILVAKHDQLRGSSYARNLMTGTDKPELIVALAGPIGTDLHGLAQTLEESLAAYGYASIQVRLSSLIEQWSDQSLRLAFQRSKQEKRIALLMATGDALRAQVNKGDALIPIVVGAIRAAREERLKHLGIAGSSAPATNTCYILDSLKHPDEVETLRNVYGENFILISAFASPGERKARLMTSIARSYMSTRNEDYGLAADELIENDSKRHGSSIGQSLRDTFPLADLFLRVSGNYTPKLDRFLALYFGSPYVTPTRDEFFMYEAKAKSLRSADLSRQIGAVIVDSQHHLVASGCNEVPIAGGGSYWPDMPDQSDNRDFKKERDFNAVKKVEIIEEFIEFLSKRGVMSLPEHVSVEEAVRSLLFGTHRSEFKELRVSNLIEFGRVVHAEMNALSEAAQRGVRVGGGTIYSTTYPCHMCARHIIAAGVMRVVYIEPYPKSMTEELFGEVVSIDAEVGVDEMGQPKLTPGVVSFQPFEGVAPNLYRDLFRAGPRKNVEGYTLTWSKSTATPKVARTNSAHLALELAMAKAVEQLTDVGLGSVSGAVDGVDDADNQGADSCSDSAG